MWLLVPGSAASAQLVSPDTDFPPASGPGEPADAARLYDEGRRYFDVGEYDRAIEKLKAAYLVAPLPELLYDLGQAFRLKGECAEALSLYRRYLKTEPPAARAERTGARIADMQACVAVATVPPPGALPPGTAPAAVQASPDVLTQAPAGPAREAPTRRRRWGVWSAVAAGALAGVSGYAAWDSHRASDQVSSAFVPGGMWTDADERAQQRGIFTERLAIGTGAAAVVAAGVAAWLLWRRDAK